MPVTPGKALPYPAPTDPVASGAENLRKLAQSVDNMILAGTGTHPTNTVGSNQDYAVVFTVPFATVPIVVLTPLTTAPDIAVACVLAGSVTTTGFTARGRRTSGGAGAFDSAWIAVGKTTLVA
jgi:hypothetical protein